MINFNKTGAIIFLIQLISFINITCTQKALSMRQNIKSTFSRVYNYFFLNKRKTIKYNLNGISATVPYEIYIIIEELKKAHTEADVEVLTNRLILYGPPGNGKSTYARKITEEINGIFYEISSPCLVDRYQGSGADNVNKIFLEAIDEQTKTGKKIVLFFDEVDAIANRFLRGERIDNKAATQALWLNLDKIKQNPNIFVILATNNFDEIHPTLLDRFADNMIQIPNPDEEMRKEVIEYYLNKFNMVIPSVDILIKKTKGLSIRSIEDTLKSVKRISKIESNGTPTEEIIEQILYAQKQKLATQSDKLMNKLTNCCRLINQINILPQTVLNSVYLITSLYSLVKRIKMTRPYFKKLRI